MAQKIVIKLEMTSHKCRSKAMKLVADTVGVNSLALAGDGKDQLVVVGDGIDCVKLTSALRKKVCHAQLVQVVEAREEEEDEKKPAETAAAAAVVRFPYPWNYQYPSHEEPVYGHPAATDGYQHQCHSRPNTCCSIM